jgi:hypothetical protein
VAIAGAPWAVDPGWAYQPGYAVGLGGLLGSLFTRPGYGGGYYFGNYFGSAAPGAGYVPWAAYGRGGYDPLLHYYRWANRGNAGWYPGLAGLYAGRMNGTLPVPAATYPAQHRAALAGGGIVYGSQAVAFPRGLSVTAHNSLRTVYPLSAAAVAPVRLTTAHPGGGYGRSYAGAVVPPGLAVPAVPRVGYGAVATGPAAHNAGHSPRITYVTPPAAGIPAAVGRPATSYSFYGPHMGQNVTHAGGVYHAGHPAGTTHAGGAHAGAVVGRTYTPAPAYANHHGGLSMSHTHVAPAHVGGIHMSGGHMSGGHMSGGHTGGGHASGGHGGHR